MRSVLLCVLLSALSAPATALSAPLVVIIDAGHGGRDHGTVRGSVQEADITLAVARQLNVLLKKDKRFTAQLTRSDDSSISLFRRAQMAKDKHADLFLSIHVNSNPDNRARGAEFYFQNQLPPDEESMFLAHQENVADEGETVTPITYEFLDHNGYPNEVSAIVNDLLDDQRILQSSQLSKALKSCWHGTSKSKSNSVRQAPFYVLNQMRTPSSLVELGFLTNKDDFAALTSPTVQRRMAEDLYRGLLQFKDSIDKGS